MSDEHVTLGDFRLDLRGRKLTRNGAPVRLGHRAVDVLCVLAAARGQIVSKDDLIARVWPGGAIGDNNLHVHISALRKIFDAGGAGEGFVVTVPGRGYRLIGLDAPNGSPVAGPALSDKPSIAVLPFANLSGDPGQDYFSDGVTRDIITELSRFSELLVIASNSSFQYRDRFPDIRDVGRALGVRYGLGGSIRRAGNRMRITAGLVDATTGVHLWAERYDRELEDVFAVEDDVVRTIVAILAAHVRKAEGERTRTKLPESLQVYDYYQQAAATYANFNSSFAVDDLYKTRRLLDRALAVDPGYGLCCALMAETYVAAFIHPLDGDLLNRAVLDTALQFARRAVQTDPNSAMAHSNLGHVFIWRRQHEESIAAFEKAVTLNPNDVDWRFAAALVYSGQPERAIEVAEAYIRRDPFNPPLASLILGFAHYVLRRYAQALPLVLDSVRRAPKLRPARAWLAATYAQLGQIEESRAEIAAIKRLQPDYTISGTLRPLMGFKHADHEKLFFDGMRKAGAPE